MNINQQRCDLTCCSEEVWKAFYQIIPHAVGGGHCQHLPPRSSAPVNSLKGNLINADELTAPFACQSPAAFIQLFMCLFTYYHY